jgi:hypothetical protein
MGEQRHVRDIVVTCRHACTFSWRFLLRHFLCRSAAVIGLPSSSGHSLSATPAMRAMARANVRTFSGVMKMAAPGLPDSSICPMMRKRPRRDRLRSPPDRGARFLLASILGFGYQGRELILRAPGLPAGALFFLTHTSS